MQIANDHLIRGAPVVGYRYYDPGNFVESSQILGYVEHDGGEALASKAKWDRRWEIVSLVLFVAGFVAEEDASQNDSPNGLNLGGALCGLGMTSFSLIRLGEIPALVRDYNNRILGDLGLSLDDLKLNYGINPKSVDPSGMYFIGNVGLALSSGYDFGDFFAPVQGTYLAQGALMVGLRGAYSWNSGFGIEAGFACQTGRDSATYWSQGPLQGQWYSVNLSQTQVDLAPTWQFAGSRSFDRRCFWTLGMRMGMADTQANGNEDNPQGQPIGGFSANASNPVFCPFVRWSSPLNGVSAFGIETGYNWDRATGLKVNSSNGSLAYQDGTLQSRHGSDATFDFSGPYLAIALAMGQIPFTR